MSFPFLKVHKDLHYISAVNRQELPDTSETHNSEEFGKSYLSVLTDISGGVSHTMLLTHDPRVRVGNPQCNLTPFSTLFPPPHNSPNMSLLLQSSSLLTPNSVFPTCWVTAVISLFKSSHLNPKLSTPNAWCRFLQISHVFVLSGIQFSKLAVIIFSIL